MASLATSVWPKPVALVPCLSWTTASPVFTRVYFSNQFFFTLLKFFYSNLGRNVRVNTMGTTRVSI